MANDIKYLKDKDIVQLKTSGTYELSKNAGTAVKVAFQLIKHNCNKCIIDHREANVIAQSYESYERHTLYEKIYKNRAIRVAIVFKEINEDYEFFETTIRNRGWNLRIFDDYDTAITWLLE